MKVKDVLTDQELSEVHRLNKEILSSSTKMEIRYYKQEIDNIIKKAVKRHYVKNKKH